MKYASLGDNLLNISDELVKFLSDTFQVISLWSVDQHNNGDLQLAYPKELKYIRQVVHLKEIWSTIHSGFVRFQPAFVVVGLVMDIFDGVVHNLKQLSTIRMNEMRVFHT